MEAIATSVEAITGAVRHAYGPLGSDQLVVTETKKLVTNSAGRILGEARPGSPLAKVILGHLRRTGEALGDGTGTLALMIDGAVGFIHATLLEGRARRPELEASLAYVQAQLVPRVVEPILCSLSAETGLGSSEERVLGLARAFFGANFAPNVSQRLAKLFWAWLRGNAAASRQQHVRSQGGEKPDGDDCGIEELAAAVYRLEKDGLLQVAAARLASGPDAASVGGNATVSASTVERAHLLSGVLGHPSMIPQLDGGFSAIVLDAKAAPLSLRVTAPEAAQNRLAEILLLSVERLWQLGVRLILCSAEVHEEWRGALARRGIAVLHLVEESELELVERGARSERVRLATDAAASLQRALLSFAAYRPLELRSAQQLAAGNTIWMLMPSVELPAPPCWLLLRAPTVALAAEYRQALWRLLRVVGAALHEREQGAAVVHAGLGFELALLRCAQSEGASVASFLDTDDGSLTLADQDKRARSLAWKILRAALLTVLEAFLANLVAPRGVSGRSHAVTGSHNEVPMEARRQARWLAVAPVEALDAEGSRLCLRRLRCQLRGEPMYGFSAFPGVGSAAGHEVGTLLETRRLKLGILGAMCGLCRQLIRLDPLCLQLEARPPGARMSYSGPCRGHAQRGGRQLRQHASGDSSEDGRAESDSD